MRNEKTYYYTVVNMPFIQMIVNTILPIYSSVKMVKYPSFFIILAIILNIYNLMDIFHTKISVTNNNNIGILQILDHEKHTK